MSLRIAGYIFFITLMHYSCSQSKTGTTCALPSGIFINMTVLNGCPDKMPVDIPYFAVEMKFNGKDTVMMDNGFEKFSLPVSATENHCEFKIAGASLYGDMLLKVTSDTTMELIDTAWTKQANASAFSRFTQGEQAEWGFDEFLNDCLVTGEYAMFKDGNLMEGVVTFMVNGQINGMKPFLGYEICYAGDCLEDTDPPSRTINLIDNQGKIETFSMKGIEGKMAIELYSIAPPVPDIKGSRAIGPMVYELRTE